MLNSGQKSDFANYVENAPASFTKLVEALIESGVSDSAAPSLAYVIRAAIKLPARGVEPSSLLCSS